MDQVLIYGSGDTQRIGLIQLRQVRCHPPKRKLGTSGQRNAISTGLWT